ncbi:MAG TPA: Ig-like domain-containing protein [Gemmatimonadaceae bacterium]|nr:Ig-like domain-containing protein [Gemmatimonadaceae bacterium]
MAAALATLVVDCGASPTPPQAKCRLTSAAITPALTALSVGQSIQLTVTTSPVIVPTNPPSCVPSYSWTTSDTSVALNVARTITGAQTNRAVASGHSLGSATISVSVGSNQTINTLLVTTVVSVVPPPIATISVTGASPSLAVSDTMTLKAVARDANGVDVSKYWAFTWQSSNAATATVSTGGLVTGIAKGPVTITASAGGVTGSLGLTVTDPVQSPVATLTVVPAIPPSTHVQVTRTIQLRAVARDASGNLVTDSTISWSSGATSIGTVTRIPNNAHLADVLGIKPGIVTITARTASGKSGTLDVTVDPGPIAAIVITPSSASVRPGKTVPLAAEARDAQGNLIPNVPFTWTSRATSIASVSQSGIVTGNVVGAADIEASASGITGTGRVSVLARRFAFAVADQPVTASYSANPAFSYTSSSGPITISRLTAGSYRVDFAGQQRLFGEVETVLVTAYGPTNGYCKPVSWTVGAASLVTDVACFTSGGLPNDLPFSITLLGDNTLAGRFSFGVANQPTAPGPYVATGMFNNAPAASQLPVTITRSAVGQYAVAFTSNGGPVNDPEAVIVNALGAGNSRCQPASQVVGDVVQVRCWDGSSLSSVPVDAPFTVALMNRGTSGASLHGVAWVDDTPVSGGGTAGIPATVAWNSTQGSVQVQWRSLGLFDVTFFGLAPIGSSGPYAVQVVDQDRDDGAYCNVVRWTATAPNLVVTVQCHAADGDVDDDAFYLVVLR